MIATTANTLTLLIVDDSELVRVGLKTLLGARSAAPELHVVGEAHSVATAVAEAARLQPDVVLLDIRLPDGSGFAACRQILAERPATRVLILTSLIDDEKIFDAMNSGAHGYLLKETNAAALCQAIVDVAAGKFILDPVMTTRVLKNIGRGEAPPSKRDKLELLSAQELRVLELVATGKTNKEIATQMKLSDKTVKNYLSNMFEKLQITRRSQAAVLFTESRPPGSSGSGV